MRAELSVTYNEEQSLDKILCQCTGEKKAEEKSRLLNEFLNT